MTSDASSDMSGLARLAQSPGSEIRPLLLRLQAREFAAAPCRDPDAIRRFEALALGLIPLVTSDVLADVAALLRSAPDVPVAVRRLLAERLVATGGAAVGDAATTRAERPALPAAEIADLLSLARDDVDLTLAGNDRIVIDGAAWHLLVARATRHGRLARRVLARREPTLRDRAAMYGYAAADERDRVRRQLACDSGPWTLPEPGHSPAWRDAILDLADRGDGAGLIQALGTRLGCRDRLPVEIGLDGGREWLILTLVALGLDAEDCIRVSLGLGGEPARSIPAVFRLAEIARTTSRATAWRIVSCLVPAATALEGRGPHQPSHQDRPSFDRGRRGFAPVTPATEAPRQRAPDRPARGAARRSYPVRGGVREPAV